MTYEEFRRFLRLIRPRVLELVRAIEADFAAGFLPTRLPPQSGWTLTPELWRALYQNAYKLLGVKRITGAPYSTHPTRMALTIMEVLQDSPWRDESAEFAMFHDYLEEGDGRTPEGVDRFRREFPGRNSSVIAAVVLSEPMIDYSTLTAPRKEAEDVAYVIQIQEAMGIINKQSLANASITDKIDNIHHLNYITKDRKSNPEKKFLRLVKKLGYFSFVEQTLGPLADPRLRLILSQAIKTQATRLGVSPSDLKWSTENLVALHSENRQIISAAVHRYHRDVGIAL